MKISSSLRKKTEMKIIFKNVLLFAVILVASGNVFSQIGGLSGSKLISYCVDVVDDKKIEFEPVFYHFASSKYWNADGELHDLYSTPDSIRKATGMGFRFTYGMFDKLEVGMAFSTDMEMGAFGIRYIVLQKKKSALALMGGLNLPLGNSTFDKRIRLAENTLSTGLGAVATFDFTQNLSLDVNAQYMFFLSETVDNDKGKLIFSADLGYYVFNHTLQLVGAAGFSSIKNGEGNHSVLTLNPGFTVETAKNFIIVMGFPFDVYGTNEAKNRGFTFALTITLD
jgi:hypothetical protein